MPAGEVVLLQQPELSPRGLLGFDLPPATPMRDVQGAEDNTACWTLTRKAERGVEAAAQSRGGGMPMPAASCREGGGARPPAAHEGPGRRKCRSEPVASAPPNRPPADEPTAAKKDREEAKHEAAASVEATGDEDGASQTAPPAWHELSDCGKRAGPPTPRRSPSGRARMLPDSWISAALPTNGARRHRASRGTTTAAKSIASTPRNAV